jgi:putative peptidoglycan lipid II flippase
MTLVLLLAPAFYAKDDFKTTTKASLIAVALNIFLNGLFVIQWKWNAGSVAFSTSLSAWVNALILSIALRNQFGHFITKNFYVCSGKILLASLTASIAILLIDMSHLHIVLRFTFQISLFTAVLASISWMLKVQNSLTLPVTTSN